MTDTVISALLLIGTFFCVVGSIGLVRLPDFFSRLHAPTKATTLGVGSMLVAAAVYWGLREYAARELLVALFLFITAPVSALMMARAALRAKLASRAPLPSAEADNE